MNNSNSSNRTKHSLILIVIFIVARSLVCHFNFGLTTQHNMLQTFCLIISTLKYDTPHDMLQASFRIRTSTSNNPHALY